MPFTNVGKNLKCLFCTLPKIAFLLNCHYNMGAEKLLHWFSRVFTKMPGCVAIFMYVSSMHNGIGEDMAYLNNLSPACQEGLLQQSTSLWLQGRCSLYLLHIPRDNQILEYIVSPRSDSITSQKVNKTFLLTQKLSFTLYTLSICLNSLYILWITAHWNSMSEQCSCSQSK